MPAESALLEAPPAAPVETSAAPLTPLEKDLAALARDARAATGWPIAQAWRLQGGDGGALALVASDHADTPATRAFETVSRGAAASTDAFLLRVVELGRPAWIDRLRSETGSTRAGAARAAGLGPAACVPVIAGDEVIGVLEVFGPRGCTAEADLVFMLARMARGAGAWTHQRMLARGAQGSAARRSAMPLDRIAHDLNDLLTVVAACSSASLEDLHDREQLREALAAMLGCVTPATALIGELLSSSDGATREPSPPAEEQRPRSPASASASAEQQGRTSGTVLLVEDEPMVRALTASLLRRWGYRVIDADSAELALARVAGSEAAIDLLVTDVVLPGLTGPDLHERMSAIHPGLPVLFFSGYVPERVARRESITPDRFLAKPFTADALRARIEQALER